ncbi:winged helix-turn-helix domain-containing protein [Mameliella alba]|uniref:winged helix-turn-helix domain-containing tetratricopeptide repeat protein n=1 Tax=Mameliella alba TaxID=561184 RepID=UPI001430BCFA|nr:tetratricopeptide repeat protein [Mameliella alba]MBY6117820.1 winged helix-turn-helix domain-containing protein [Mameliella alba]
MFDPETGEILIGDTRMSLRPQSARVLALLQDGAGALMSKSALLDRVWPNTHVTEDSLVQCVSEIRKALKGVSGVSIRTVPKKGYVLDLAPTVAPADGETRPRTRRPTGAVALVAALLAVAAIAVSFWLIRPAPDTPPSTIAVLPFKNMSGDPDQAYLSNGLAEDLIVDLSGLSDIRVVSRAASFSLGGGEMPVQEIADTLRADVIVEGSIRRVADTLRISVALVDGKTGTNLWANRFEGAFTDIFAFQDQVAKEVVRTLSVRLSDAERLRLGVRGTKSVAAHDAYLRGRQLENLYTAETNIEAEAALREAIRIDPNYALPHAHLAQVFSFRVENNWSHSSDADIAAAFDHAEKALALDPDLPFAHFSLGRLYTRSFAPNEARAIKAYETALRLDPNYDDAYVFLANIHIFNGRAEAALPLIAEAFARNPLPPYWYDLAEGMAQYFLGNYAAAEPALVRARDQNATAPYPYRFLMATYGQLGDPDEADWMAMEYETLGRKATVSALLETASIQDSDYRAAFAEGFRLAGLPEQ